MNDVELGTKFLILSDVSDKSDRRLIKFDAELVVSPGSLNAFHMLVQVVFHDFLISPQVLFIKQR